MGMSGRIVFIKARGGGVGHCSVGMHSRIFYPRRFQTNILLTKAGKGIRDRSILFCTLFRVFFRHTCILRLIMQGKKAESALALAALFSFR